MSDPKEGQLVRVVIEGKAIQVARTARGYLHMTIGDNDIYIDDPDNPDVKASVEVVRPAIQQGQIWRTVSSNGYVMRWLIRWNDNSGLKAISQKNTLAIDADSFLHYYPNAELLLDSEENTQLASDAALDALRAKLAG